ncbi:ubiquitin-conjugating enzyme E2 10-like [Forsythia ovata]|uniref:Ubiquitin-conjugating enzyme E2 10-like n=1 Tax=Forsythia ovata TaxID=205694 RepID=A0ABD1X9Q7_9LAMI
MAVLATKIQICEMIRYFLGRIGSKQNYDNWERLVGAVLQREKDQEVARADSRSTSTSSSLDFGELSLSLLREEQNVEIGGRNSRFDANTGPVAEDLLYWQATIMGPMDSSYTGGNPQLHN